MEGKKPRNKKLEVPIEGDDAHAPDGQGTGAPAVLPPIRHEDIEITFEDTGGLPRSLAERATQLGSELEESESLPAPVRPQKVSVEEFPEYRALREERDKLQQENEKHLHEKMVFADQLRRKMADLDNFRKRLDRERAEFQLYAHAQLVTDLLPFLDNLELALSHVNHESNKAFVEGVELIYRQAREMLSKHGVRQIQAKGEMFDPNFHQAIGVVETEEVAEGHVADELLPGYMIHDRLLRPARVRVARAPSSSTQPPEAEPAVKAE